MHFERASRRTQELNLTSLVDVVFLLIIFFMLTTSFIKIDAIEMSLPEDAKDKTDTTTPQAASSKLLTDSVTLVDIADDGRVYLNRKLISDDDLQDTIQNIMRDHKDMEILVRSAAHVNVQKLVDVMDIVHVSGGRKIAVDTWDGILPLTEPNNQTQEPQTLNPFAPLPTQEKPLPTETKPDVTTKNKPAKKTFSLSPRTQAARAKMYQPPKDAPVNTPLQRLRNQLELQ